MVDDAPTVGGRGPSWARAAVWLGLAFVCAPLVRAEANPSAPGHDSDAGAFGDFEQEFAAAADRGGAGAQSDPLRYVNRAVFHFNDRLYFWALKPLAQGYSFVFPSQARACVARFSGNLGFPRNCANKLLQGKWRATGIECARFGINTTLGVFGLFDPAAKDYKLVSTPEDFGQTLGHYRVGTGWPVMLPVLGPANVRDAVGKVPDYLLDPISYLGSLWTSLGVRAYERTNLVSLHIGDYEAIRSGALEPYVRLMDAYDQHRRQKVKE